MQYLPVEEVLDLILNKTKLVEDAVHLARLSWDKKSAERLAFAIGELEGARQMIKWDYESLVSYSWAGSTMIDRYLLDKQQKTEFP